MPWPAHTIPAVVTPFSEGGDHVILDWIPKHLAFLDERGVDGVLMLGTNGEGPSLSVEERKQIIDITLEHRGDMGVVIGTGCPSLTDTIDLSLYALEWDADALLIIPPYYFKDISPRGLFDYFDAILRAMPSERRVILYNYPKMSQVEITEDLVAALLHKHPKQLLGIKDTSGDLARTRAYIGRFPDLKIWAGADSLIGHSLQAGAIGCISAVANVFPEETTAVWHATNEGGDVAAAQEAVTRISNLMADFPSFTVTKHMLHMVADLPLTYVRPPLVDLTPEQSHELRRRLQEMGLLH